MGDNYAQHDRHVCQVNMPTNKEYEQLAKYVDQECPICRSRLVIESCEDNIACSFVVRCYKKCFRVDLTDMDKY